MVANVTKRLSFWGWCCPWAIRRDVACNVPTGNRNGGSLIFSELFDTVKQIGENTIGDEKTIGIAKSQPIVF